LYCPGKGVLQSTGGDSDVKEYNNVINNINNTNNNSNDTSNIIPLCGFFAAGEIGPKCFADADDPAGESSLFFPFETGARLSTDREPKANEVVSKKKPHLQNQSVVQGFTSVFGFFAEQSTKRVRMEEQI